jgi:anti-anti-sigma factor
MKTRITRTKEATVIYMDGRMNYEEQDKLRVSMNRIVDEIKKDSVPKMLIFDMEGLDFVGSTGISCFVQTLQEVNQKSPIRPAYSHVSREFQQIIRAFDDSDQFQFDLSALDEPPSRPIREPLDN